MLLIVLFQFGCSSLEKERLDFDKERLAFDKEKLAFEKEKYSSCKCCANDCNCNSSTVILKTDEMKKTKCDTVPTPSSEEIWALSVEGGWSYSPVKIRSGEICKEEIKESFYKQFNNSESYVAKNHVPRTRQSSCINNVLISSKDKLYELMVDKTYKEENKSRELNKEDKKEVIKDIVDYNTSGKERSFYFECKPTDTDKAWDKCACVLYASYSGGKQGLLSTIIKK